MHGTWIVAVSGLILVLVLVALVCVGSRRNHPPSRWEEPETDVVRARFPDPRTWFPDIEEKAVASNTALLLVCDARYAYRDMCERWKRYATRHGYDCYVVDPDRSSLQVPTPHWYKVFATDRLLTRGYEYVAFVDADTIVVRPERTIHSFERDGFPETSFWIGADLSRSSTRINTGAFVAKNSPFVRRMLRFAMEESQDERARPNEWPREQGSMDRWLKRQSKRAYRVYPYGKRMQIFSTFRDPARECSKVRKGNAWVLHFAGGYKKEEIEHAFETYRLFEDLHPV